MAGPRPLFLPEKKTRLRPLLSNIHIDIEEPLATKEATMKTLSPDRNLS